MAQPTPRADKSKAEAVIYEDVLRSNQLEGWKKELEDRVHDFNGTVDQFMNVFVPSSAPPPPAAPLQDPFATFDPQPGQEVRSYGGLVRP